MINCGAVKLHSSQTERITLEYHRMKIIKKEILEQTKATLNKTDYIRSPNITENIIQSPWTSVINSVGTYQ